MKPLLLGEAPGASGRTDDPLGGRTARRLTTLAGWPAEEGADPHRAALIRRFELRNLLDEPPGQQSRKGARFPLAEAREAAKGLDLRGRTVVVLGKRLARALGLQGVDYFEWIEALGAHVVVIPHPSGVNRALNDPETRRVTGAILRAAAA